MRRSASSALSPRSPHVTVAPDSRAPTQIPPLRSSISVLVLLPGTDPARHKCYAVGVLRCPGDTNTGTWFGTGSSRILNRPVRPVRGGESLNCFRLGQAGQVRPLPCPTRKSSRVLGCRLRGLGDLVGFSAVWGVLGGADAVCSALRGVGYGRWWCSGWFWTCLVRRVGPVD